MIRLLLLRHAEAVAHAAGGDSERPLAETGCREAAKIAAYLAKKELLPTLSLVSTSLRTRETFEIIARAFGKKLAVDFQASLYNGGARALQAALGQAPASTQTLLIIGHNPGLAEFASSLTRDGDSEGLARMRHRFPTAGLAVIDFSQTTWSEASQGHGRLKRFVTPASLSS
jgi:phosphohistidine phosphatase